MSAKISRDAAASSLRSMGVGEPAIARALDAEYGDSGPVTSSMVKIVSVPLTFPIRLTLPWSALCSDNEREKASLYMQGGKPVPRKVMGARYKTARSKTVAVARETMHGFPALSLPLAIHARVYVPDERLHDVVNFAKGVHDALEGIVYVNDSWLHRALWERAGVDVDHPRAEITIEPLGSVR